MISLQRLYPTIHSLCLPSLKHIASKPSCRLHIHTILKPTPKRYFNSSFKRLEQKQIKDQKPTNPIEIRNPKEMTEPKKPDQVMEPKKSLWQKAKAEAKHYWLGTKLLAKEIRISTRLLWKLLSGHKLLRREHNQLLRTAGDLFRLIPFAFFIIVPFMEFLLPIALRLFPNMLPSTYTDKEKEEAKRRQVMARKLNMAKFLRDSISESSKQFPGADPQEFANFFKKYRTTNQRASTQEVLDICKKFSDDLTLDNLSRPQLVTLCRFIGIHAFGTDNFLRYILHSKMREINNDDKMILAEGIDSLTFSELIVACQARGIRTIDVPTERLRYELQQWLDLHLKNEIPPTLLILSRALMLTDRPLEQESDQTEALQNTLTSLPNVIVEEAELRLSEADGKISIEKKLEIIQKEEKKILDELEAAKKRESEELEKSESKAPEYFEKEKKEKSGNVN